MFGLFPLSFWGYVLVTLVMTHFTVLGVTIFLHRNQAHRSVELHPIVSHFFRFWLWLTTGMITKEWVAIHRKHHANVETSGDPHSPKMAGIKKVLFEGTELYRKAAKDKQILEQYGHGTPDDVIERNVYERYQTLGIISMLVIDLVCFGLPGLSIWAIQMMWIPFFAAGVINGIGHYWGYRNFETSDASRNILPWGVLLCGEELHNNHHAFASSAKFSSKWWEFDISWFYIKILSALGLAHVKKLPPKLLTRLDSTTTVDAQTLQVLLLGRLEILSQYQRNVIRPALKLAKQEVDEQTRPLFKRASKLFIRDKELLSEPAVMQLQKLLQTKDYLKLIYQFGEQLKNVWDGKQGSQSERLQILQQWCKKAETSGIRYLEDFVTELKQLTVVQVAA